MQYQTTDPNAHIGYGLQMHEAEHDAEGANSRDARPKGSR
jgi:hypothetical protein